MIIIEIGWLFLLKMRYNIANRIRSEFKVPRIGIVIGMLTQSP